MALNEVLEGCIRGVGSEYVCSGCVIENCENQSAERGVYCRKRGWR